MLKREGKKSLATEARHYVEIQRVVSTPDDEGGFTEAWYVLKSCWAAIYPIRALQRFEYKSLDVEATHFFRLRGYIDCIESDRIVFDDRAFEVLTVENIQEKDVVLFVVCKEIRKEPGSSSVTGEPGLVIYSGSYLRLDQTQPQAVTGGSPTVEGLQFDVTPSTSNVSEGLLRWNETDGTLDLGMSGGDITMQVGQEMFTKVRNVSGSIITNGSLVYFSGRTGNRPTIELARGDAEATSRVSGMATQDISSPADGYITTIGYVRQIDTRGTDEGETWAEGDMLWLSTTLAGHATNVIPTVPNYSDVIGTVGVSGNVGIGSILLNINRTHRLEDLKDVNGTALDTNGQIAVWDNDNSYFDFTDNIKDYFKVSGVVLSSTSATNTTDETSVYTASVPQNTLSIGNLLKLNMTGEVDEQSASDRCTIRVKFGTITMVTLISPGVGTSNLPWDVSGSATIRSIGAAGVMAWHIDMHAGSATTSLSGVTTIDTTVQDDISVTAEWNNAKVGNVFTCEQGFIETKG